MEMNTMVIWRTKFILTSCKTQQKNTETQKPIDKASKVFQSLLPNFPGIETQPSRAPDSPRT